MFIFIQVGALVRERAELRAALGLKRYDPPVADGGVPAHGGGAEFAKIGEVP